MTSAVLCSVELRLLRSKGVCQWALCGVEEGGSEGSAEVGRGQGCVRGGGVCGGGKCEVGRAGGVGRWEMRGGEGEWGGGGEVEWCGGVRGGWR